MQLRRVSGYASASIRLTKLKLSASMYARPKLWADALILETGRYTRERKDRTFLSLLVTRGRRATRSDTQTNAHPSSL